MKNGTAAEPQHPTAAEVRLRYPQFSKPKPAVEQSIESLERQLLAEARETLTKKISQAKQLDETSRKRAILTARGTERRTFEASFKKFLKILTHGDLDKDDPATTQFDAAMARITPKLDAMVTKIKAELGIE